MKTPHEIGAYGEELALDYLLRQGMKLLQKNYRSGHYQVDLILENEEAIIFVEVKTSSKTPLQDPFDPRQLTRIKQAANRFLQANQKQKEFRLDLIHVKLYETSIKRIEHLKNVQ
ncbi:MAG: YraN family protein [Flavobacteriaceae bacterium]